MSASDLLFLAANELRRLDPQNTVLALVNELYSRQSTPKGSDAVPVEGARDLLNSKEWETHHA